MTGFGESRSHTDDVGITVEIKSVNNRYLKVSTRLPEAYSALEGQIERAVRAAIVRGTVHVTLRAHRTRTSADFTINGEALKSYHDQLIRFSQSTGLHPPHDAGALLNLPGVIAETEEEFDPEAEWPVIQQCLEAALSAHREFRITEGRHMAEELQSNRDLLENRLETVAGEAPQVVEDYRDRVLQRVRQLLQNSNVELAASDIIREVSLFADRCDITEEITRLKSHLAQFQTVIESDQSQGRQLEFLGQEMFREINTIGAKANSVTIAHCVVEMKAAIEKMREILQNVE